jgi:tRNA nucleotidyltransferase/poly(A) polymerase
MGFGKILKYKLFLESVKSDMWNIIPESVKDLQKMFSKKGKKLYVVGGAVRDFLKGDKPKDFDLCTDALPDEVLEIIGTEYKTNLQGKSFGVVVVYTDDEPTGMEIATFRSDTYDGKSRNPKVEYTTIENDVLRRDLSINSLFYDLEKKEIIDLVGGISDLESKVIRMVGDPEKRIEEDPLRIMRAIRSFCRM